MLTTEEKELAAYMAGDRELAECYGKLIETERRLAQAVEALKAIANDLGTVEQMRGCAKEGLMYVE